MLRPHSLTTEQLKEKFEEIEALNIAKMTIDDIKPFINVIMTGFTFTSLGLHPPVTIYRAIKYSDRPEHVKYVGAPPAHIAKVNRASRPGLSVFYGSIMREVPFFELDCQLGDKLILSKWVTTKKMLVNNVGFSDEVFQLLGASRTNPDFGGMPTGGPAVLLEQNKLTRDFMARLFSQPIGAGQEDLYKLTIAIAEKLLHPGIKWENDTPYERSQFDALIYPTIKTQGASDNYAILPHFIEESGLKLKTVEYLEIVPQPTLESDSFGVGPEAIISAGGVYWAKSIAEADEFAADGTIIWKDRISQWSSKVPFEDLTFTEEDGKWIARDDSGNIVEPDS